MKKFFVGILLCGLILSGCGDESEQSSEQPSAEVEKPLESPIEARKPPETSTPKPSTPKPSRSDKPSEKPTDFFANRAVDNYNRGNYHEALSNANEAIRLDGRNIAAYTYRGHIYNALGNYTRAIDDFSRAIELDERNSSAYSGRGVAFGNSGDYNKAIADLDRAIALKPTVAAYENRAKCHEILGDEVQAQSDFAKARELGG